MLSHYDRFGIDYLRRVSKPHDPYAAMRYREFRFFVWAKLLLTIALQMQALIASWMIYASTRDPFSLGLIGLTEAIPALGLALAGGYLADRFNRRKILLYSCWLMLLASVLLVLYAAFFREAGTWPAYVVIFIIGLARGFYNPSQAAFWAQLVPRDQYINSSVWNSSMWQIGAVGGPALGGLLYALAGPVISLLVVCLLIVLVLIYYSLISDKALPVTPKKESIRDSLMQGIRFVFSQKVFLGAISLDLFAVLFGGAVALLPAFADQILHTGPEGLGILRSAPALGAVIMSVYLAFHPPRQNAGKLMLGCVALFGLCMIGFALSKNFLLSFSFLLLSGMVDNVSVVIRSTILQLFTPEEMRGRVSAVNSIFIGSSNELGAFESGLAARLLGLVPSVVFGGCMTLLVTGLTARLAPDLKRLDLSRQVN